jgi:hypothetical protein
VQINLGEGLDGLSFALLTRVLGWSKDEVLAFLIDVRKNIRNSKIYCYWPNWGKAFLLYIDGLYSYVVYGQKPMS